MLNLYSEPLFPSSDSECPSSSFSSVSTVGEASDKDNPDPRSEPVLLEEESQGPPAEGSQEEAEFDLMDVAVRASALRQEYLTTGCRNLDELLKGGIPVYGITELFGDAGSGKTQLCLQLAITAQLSKKERGLDSGVLYICTEDVFPSKRLGELIFHFKKRFPAALPTNPMNHVFVEHLVDPDDLMNCLDVKLEALARHKNVRLVILDSVAGIFRTECDDLKKRTMGLRQLGQALHAFSLTYKAAIIVCNQVTANLQVGGNIAALGMAWKNMITTRIKLSKSDDHQYRFLETEFSPHAPKKRVSFQVNAGGVQFPIV